jgi:hypothetical protein
MTCGKCKKGELELIKVRRFPAAVANIGYGLAALALLAVLGVSGYLYKYGPGGTVTSASEVVKQDAVTKLRQIEGVTPAMITDFEEDGQIATASLDALNGDVRSEVDRVLEEYHAATVNLPANATVPGSGGSWATWIAILVACVILLIAGLWLTLSKDAWRCASCGATTVDDF